MQLSKFPTRKLLLKDATIFEQAIVLLLYVAVLGSFVSSIKAKRR